MIQTLWSIFNDLKKCNKIFKITRCFINAKQWVYCEYLIYHEALKFRLLRADRPWGGWGWPAGSEDVRGPVCWGETCCLRRAKRTSGWCPSRQHSCVPNSAPFSRPEYRHLCCSRLSRRTPPEPGRLLKNTTTISRAMWMSEQLHHYTIFSHLMMILVYA